MTHKETTLPNGLRIVTAHMADAFSVTASIAVGVGSRYEDFEVNGGVTHFLEHLFFKGTKKRPSTKIISEQIDAVGGYNNAYTSNDMTNYYVKAPYQHLGLALDILSDMLRDSLFDAAEIDRERGVVLEEMNVYHDDPHRYVYRLTPPLLWPGHPLSQPVLGSEDVIKNITRDQIVSYKESHYKPGNMVVAIAGRVDHDAAVKMVTGLLGDLPAEETPAELMVEKTLAPDMVASLTKDTAQTHLTINTIAYPTRHAKDPAARVIAAILGRGLSSRLFLNVRERKGLAYSINAGTDSFVDTGEFAVYAGVNLDKTNDAIVAILEELEKIRTEPVGAEELAKAKSQLSGGLQMAMESNGAIADRLATQMVIMGSIKSVEQSLKDINGVTAEDVQAVAAEMLEPSRLRMGIISPDPSGAIKTFEQAIKGEK
ncbi:MAG TPA: pitrilysin family protein [Candidatus Saccharimonadales bacterium]|nr:pitrilysin family protein [Candidatus Saccharimonadales bacterium]